MGSMLKFGNSQITKCAIWNGFCTSSHSVLTENIATLEHGGYTFYERTEIGKVTSFGC